ncbi:MAG TPA: ABC transporter permease [Bryobacteraceae bacterium]|nr:ABC transporter permease [Bryobacteraceae bacterium]
MRQDLFFGLRMLLKSPGFSALALVTLALGIGANTTMFSVVDSVLLRPLPYKDPDRIVQIEDRTPVGNALITSSFPKFNFFHDHARGFAAIAAASGGRFQISGPAMAEPIEVAGARVSTDFFRVFGVEPVAGRVFDAGEDRPGAKAVAVIGHALWQSRFAADPGVLGKTVTVDGAQAAIIGIMPPGFDYPAESEVWVPKIFEHPSITPVQIERGASYLFVYGRLADGTDRRAAQAEATALAAQYDESHKGFGDTDRPIRVDVLRETLVGDIRRTLLVLLGAVAFVLLIASANVANLLLARAVARQKEVAIRAALGASRMRLLGQFLTESLLLAFLGAGLGILLAGWSIGAIRQIGPGILPRAGEIRLNTTVLLFTIAVAAITGIVFGLGPAMHAARSDLNEALKATSRTLSGAGRLRGVAIVAEVALAMVLLTGAGLLMRSFLRLEAVAPGFRPEHLLTMRIGLPSARYPQNRQRTIFYDEVLERVIAIPSVRSAALTNALPVNGPSIGYFFNIEGRPALEPTKAPTAWLKSVSPEYFETLGIPILAGRVFTQADTADSPVAMIINQTMARRYWPNQNPIGQHIIYARESVRAEIVGVAGDVKITGLGDNTPYNEFYVPYRQRPFLTMFLVTRGETDIASAARRVILSVDPEQPVASVRTMDEVIAGSLSQPRLRTALIASFAGLAVVLTMIGIAGVVAWSVSQRTSEIAIRMALGARPRNVLAMIVGQAFVTIGLGEAIGVVGALALTRVLSNFLFGVAPEDPATFATVLFLLSAVALAACLLAARRALAIDPVSAIRAE